MTEMGSTETATTGVLRVGVVIHTPVLAQYQAEILRALRAGSYAAVEVVLRRPSTGMPPRPGVLFELYRRQNERGNDRRLDPLTPTDCTEELASVPTVTVDEGSEHAVIAALGARHLDVVLDFRSHPSAEGLTSIARYGVWSIVPGDAATEPGASHYFWELWRRSPVSAVSVVAQRDDGRIVLARGFFPTQARTMAGNRRQPFWGATVLIEQRLRALHDHGWEAAAAGAVPAGTGLGGGVYPSNWQMARWLARHTAATLRKRFEKPAVTHWRVAIRVGSPLRLAGDGAPDLDGFRLHESPVGHYYADPFLWEREGRHWLFFEDYEYRTRHGTLACAEVRSDATLGPVQTVLERPYHLSYPCLFEDGGELYMVPETADNDTVELYRCVEFPGHWELERTLLDVGGLDPTIMKSGDHYWLLTSIREPRTNARQLRLYLAPSLDGEWSEHPANPISTDIRTNRGGGAFVHDGERLFRVSQDCSTAYGYSFSVHEITALTPHRYAERPVLTVEPTWAQGLVGTHTYARCGEIEAIDGAVRRPRQGTAE